MRSDRRAQRKHVKRVLHLERGLALFFFQAEDGIRDYKVTGAQTCALPISAPGDVDGLGGDGLGEGDAARLLQNCHVQGSSGSSVVVVRVSKDRRQGVLSQRPVQVRVLSCGRSVLAQGCRLARASGAGAVQALWVAMAWAGMGRSGA